MVSDIICLQETGTVTPRLPGYSCFTAGGGNNKGVAVYVKDGMARSMKEQPEGVIDDYYQGLKLTFGPFDLITIYRASDQPALSFKRLAAYIANWMKPKRATIICGDFNFDRRQKNDLTMMLRTRGFKQIVDKPTHIRGGSIDHFYHNIPEAVKKIEYKLRYPYYSDHEAICVMINNV